MSAPTAVARLTQEVIAGLEPAILRDFYQDLHRHPELAFQEHRTAAKLATRLRAAGYDVLPGKGKPRRCAEAGAQDAHRVHEPQEQELTQPSRLIVFGQRRDVPGDRVGDPLHDLAPGGRVLEADGEEEGPAGELRDVRLGTSRPLHGRVDKREAAGADEEDVLGLEVTEHDRLAPGGKPVGHREEPPH